MLVTSVLIFAGVRVGKSSGATDVYAPLVISDAGVVNTFTSLVPQEHAKKSGQLAIRI